jgi:nucleoporin POM152
MRYQTRQFSGHREQIELVPDEAGAYKYKFIEIKDQYYDSIPLSQDFKQEVKPSASAYLAPPPVGGLNLCKGTPAIFGVRLSGEPPFALEYEVIHGKSKKKGVVADIEGRSHELQIKDLNDGGEYTLSITSVTDKTGCKEFLSIEQPFHVWSQRPTASFAAIDRKFSARILEGKSLRLPLRFTGQSPFLYKITHQESGDVHTQRISHASAVFEAKKSGVYEITEIEDVHCPGVVDEKANIFKMDWVARPSLSFAQSPAVSQIDTRNDKKWSKKEVCEGDDDYVELAFQGMLKFSLYCSPRLT